MDYASRHPDERGPRPLSSRIFYSGLGVDSMSQFQRIITLVVLLTAACGSSAEDVARLTTNTTRILLAPCLSVYRDVSGAFTLDQTRQAFREGRFQPRRKSWPSFGFTPDAIWTRFAVCSENAGQTFWLTELRTANLVQIASGVNPKDGQDFRLG